MPSAASAGAAASAVSAAAASSAAIAVVSGRRVRMVVVAGGGAQRSFGQLASRPIGALRRSRLTEVPARMSPVRRTSTHWTIVLSGSVYHTTRVGFVRERGACAVCDW